MEQHAFTMGEVKIAKKGQITIPKHIRDEDKLEENDILMVTHLPGGEILLQKQVHRDPVDMILEALRASPHIDVGAVWEEVKAERRRERV